MPMILRMGLFVAPRWLLLAIIVQAAAAATCTRQRAASFQHDDCYLPPLNPDLAFTEASFVMSHDAATGYLTRSSSGSSSSISQTAVARSYSQTQAYGSSLYEQLQNGARALDIRPYLLWNMTVVFQHDTIKIPVSLATAVQHVVAWCHENPDELVLFLPSHFQYQPSDTVQFSSGGGAGVDDTVGDATVSSGSSHGVSDMLYAMASVFDSLGVAYYDCWDVYGLTVQDVMDMAALGTGGSLLVLWNSNTGRSCLKENWVEDRLVTCYPATGVACTSSQRPWRYLQQYLEESAYNDATDSSSSLGPPASTYNTPLNELQALWQVNTGSVVTGVSHASTLLADNRQSRVNARVVEWIYQQQEDFRGVVVAVDNIALHGNAILSVLRNQCSQLQQYDENDDGTTVFLPCGSDLPMPSLRTLHGWHRRWTKPQWLMGLASMMVLLLVGRKAYTSRRMLRTALTEIVTDAPEDMAMCYHRECGGGEYGLQTVVSALDEDDGDGIVVVKATANATRLIAPVDVSASASIPPVA